MHTNDQGKHLETDELPFKSFKFTLNVCKETSFFSFSSFYSLFQAKGAANKFFFPCSVQVCGTDRRTKSWGKCSGVEV